MVIFYFSILLSLFKGGIDIFSQVLVFSLLILYLLLPRKKVEFNPVFFAFLVFPLFRNLSFASLQTFYILLIYLLLFSIEIKNKNLLPLFLLLYFFTLFSFFFNSIPFFGNINIKTSFFVLTYIFLFEYFSTTIRILFLIPVLFSLIYFKSMLSLIVLISFLLLYFKKKKIFVLFILFFILFFLFLVSKGLYIDRIKWFKLTLILFKENFLTGIGWGNFKYFVPCFFKGNFRTLFAHSSFFQLLCEGGISFLILSISFFVFYSIEKKYLFLPLTMFLIFDYYLYIPSWGFIFILLLKNSIKKRIQFNLKRIYVILILIISGFFYIKIFISDIYFARGNYFLTKNELGTARNYYRKSIKFFKHHYTVFAGIATINYLKNDFSSAIENLEKAIFIKNKNFPPKIYLEKSKEALKKNDIKNFHKYFRKSVSFLYLLEGIVN